MIRPTPPLARSAKKFNGAIIPQAKIGDRRGKNNPVADLLPFDSQGGKKVGQSILLF